MPFLEAIPEGGNPMKTKIFPVLALCLAGLPLLAACGQTPGTGAALSAATGGNPLTGALIGGGVGAVGGAVTSPDTVNLGQPIWR